MNTSDQPDPAGQPSQNIPLMRGKWRQRKGVALILVVSFIVLMSALVVGFFSRVTTELNSARTYAESISARQLAESAVSVVMGQIRAATTVPNGCWASQPGMIRVYGTGTTASTQAYQFYKLYSSHNLVLKQGDLATFNPNDNKPASGGNAEVPIGTGGWQFQPAYFTDLNEFVELTTTNPVTGAIKLGPNGRPVTTKRYPIFDPSVARIPALGQNTGAISGSWPKGSVEGCAVNLKDAQTLQLNNAPMPVRWIYVLKDGTLTAPTPLSGPAAGVTGLQAKWNNVGNPKTPSTGEPTRNNPIVGRIAFWTDDDTCKININTAGGYVADEPANPNYLRPTKTVPEGNQAYFAGSFWDTPRVQTYFDRGVNNQPSLFRGGLASSQPVRNEFQRYPGHPSTTSLGLALKGLMPAGFTSEILYAMTPRLMPGASQGGTRQLVAYDMQINPADYGITPDPPAFQKKTFDSKNLTVIDPTTGRTLQNPSFHLYSSLDEMYYTTLNNPEKNYPEILSNTVVSNADGSRVTANKELKVNNNPITPDLIDKTRFVLTAHSRSPELNVFGRPRVTVWPIPTKNSEQQLLSTSDPDTKKLGIRNPSDDLFQFVSTVGSDPNPPGDPNGLIRLGQFIYDREDPYSPTSDFNRPRNRQIFNYLQELTSNSKGRIPGYGQSFEAKYTGGAAGRSQILTEIFDYIRSVNLKDTSRDQRIDRSQGRTSSTQKVNANAEKLKGYARYAKRGVVVPTRTTINGAPVSGFGRFPTVSEVSLVFYCGGYIYKKRDKDGNPDPKSPEQVEYDYKKIDERNLATGNATDTFFKTNVLTYKLMRAFLIIETFNPMQGYGPVTGFATLDPQTKQPLNERIVYEMATPFSFTVKSTSMETAQSVKLGTDTNNVNNVTLSSGDTWAGRNFGGSEGFFHTLQGKTANDPNKNTVTSTVCYPFQTPCLDPILHGIRIPINQKDANKDFDTEFEFSGGKMTIDIRYRDNAQAPLPPHNDKTPIQTLVLNWPASQQPWPVPITEREAGRWANIGSRADLIKYYGGGTLYSGEAFRQVGGGFDPEALNFDADQATANWPGHNEKWSNWNSTQWSPGNPSAYYSGYAMAFSLPARIAWSQRHSWSPWTGANGLNDTSGNQVANGKRYLDRYKQIVQPGDTIRSLQPGDDTLPEASDVRTTHLQQSIVTFKPHPDYFTYKPDPTTKNPNPRRRAQSLRAATGEFYFTPTDPVWFPNEAGKVTSGVLAQLPGNTRYLGNTAPDLVKGVIAKQSGGKAADFDTGIGSFPDGAFCGKADEGNIARSWIDEFKIWHYVEPYFSTWAYDSPGDTYFSPNRQIPSPVMFGSLLAPNVALDKAGWKTLLFCPNPAAGAKSVTDTYNPSAHHHGFANPPDHLLLDLFNMPVIEPYAISEPFSTDGKVNLNYHLMPFGYIERSTALRAALHPLRVTAIPAAFNRKGTGNVTELAYKGIDNDENLRYLVDREETLKGFEAFFSQFGPGKTAAGFFKTASQVCEMFLYPKGQPVSSKGGVRGSVTFTPGDSNIKTWWSQCAVTGDNVREKPYSDLYSRVTTKSNTYTVHYRVQSLRQQPFNGDPNSQAANDYYKTWDETRDKVLSEYRGHTTIERYLDPRDSRFTFATSSPAPPAINPETQSLESAYRFRVIYNKRFSPW